MLRREEAKTKIYQPGCDIVENGLMEDLADLRSMVSRAYLLFLVGADDTKKFHHIHSRSGSSYGERDVRFNEFLYQVATKVVWIALLKRNQNFIGNYFLFLLIDIASFASVPLLEPAHCDKSLN